MDNTNAFIGKTANPTPRDSSLPLAHPQNHGGTSSTLSSMRTPASNQSGTRSNPNTDKVSSSSSGSEESFISVRVQDAFAPHLS